MENINILQKIDLINIIYKIKNKNKLNKNNKYY